MQELIDTLWATAAVLVSTAATVAVTYLRAWLTRQTERIHSDAIRARLQEAKDVVQTAFMATAGPVYAKLKAATADGRLTADERTELKLLVYETAMSLRSKKFWQMVTEENDVAHLQSWIARLTDAELTDRGLTVNTSQTTSDDSEDVKP